MISKWFEAVIFDLDGVITDTAKYHFFAWSKLAKELGIYFDEVINERLKGIDRLSSLEIILENAATAFSSDEKLKIADLKNDYYRQSISMITPDDLLPGALKVLQSLKEKDILLGLASASRNATWVIERLAIKDYFDYMVDASTISKGKPDPEIFLAAALGLQASPQHCIGVEDSVAGITAIKKAGMYAVGVGSPLVLTEADVVITSLLEFGRYL